MQTIRQFASIARRYVMSIRFENRSMYSMRPELEEQIRRDAYEDLVDMGLLEDPAYDGAVMELGPAHTGGKLGTTVDTRLHSTGRIYNKNKKLLKTIHIIHDPAVVGPLLSTAVAANSEK